MLYALILENTIREYRDYAAPPVCKIIDGLPVLRPVVDSVIPPFDPITQRLTYVDNITDTQVNRVWMASALPPDIIAANQEQAAQADILAQAKADTFVQAFVSMSITDVTNYVEANVTDLASAKALLKKMAVMLLLLARREYK